MIRVTGRLHGFSSDEKKGKTFNMDFDSLEKFEEYIFSLPGVHKFLRNPIADVHGYSTTFPYQGERQYVEIFFIVTGDSNYPLLTVDMIKTVDILKQDDGIIFSNGRRTKDHRYASYAVRDFANRCRQRLAAPDYKWA